MILAVESEIMRRRPNAVWELIVESAPGRTGPPAYRHGIEVQCKPIHQHVTAENICD